MDTGEGSRAIVVNIGAFAITASAGRKTADRGDAAEKHGMHIRLAGDDAVLGRFAVAAAVIAPLTIEVPADVGVRVDEAGRQREVLQLYRRSRAGR
jgi:hypothetical protein